MPCRDTDDHAAEECAVPTSRSFMVPPPPPRPAVPTLCAPPHSLVVRGDFAGHFDELIEEISSAEISFSEQAPPRAPQPDVPHLSEPPPQPSGSGLPMSRRRCSGRSSLRNESSTPQPKAAEDSPVAATRQRRGTPKIGGVSEPALRMGLETVGVPVAGAKTAKTDPNGLTSEPSVTDDASDL
jgi:hypothetical protein